MRSLVERLLGIDDIIESQEEAKKILKGLSLEKKHVLASQVSGKAANNIKSSEGGRRDYSDDQKSQMYDREILMQMDRGHVSLTLIKSAKAGIDIFKGLK